MKKIVKHVGLMLLFASPLFAEDNSVDMMLKEMGYLSPEISINVANDIKTSNKKVKQLNENQKKKNEQKKLTKTILSQISFEKENILIPRISETTESPDMIPALLRYHKANPKSEKITKKLAVATYSIGQYKESLYWYTLTFQRNRNDLEALWNMATLSDSIGEKLQTKNYLTEYIKLDSGSVYGKKARSLLKSGYFDDYSEKINQEIDEILSNNPINDNQNDYSCKSVDSNKDNRMILVSADEDDLEAFVVSQKLKENFGEITTKDGDTLKGKGQPKILKDMLGSKTFSEKPSEKVKLTSSSINTDMRKCKTGGVVQSNEDETVKIVAAPLGS